MRMKFNLLALLLLLGVTLTYGQAKKSTSSKSKTAYSTPTNWGVGLRLGDPMGFSAKKYLTGGKSVEFNIGNSGSYGYDYRDAFYDNRKYQGYDYMDYRRKASVSIQAHYLFQKDLPDAKGLQWYWGFGPQLRINSYDFEYRYRDYFGPGDGDFVWVYGQDSVSDVDFGADGVLGLEYHIPDAPLSVFGDVNLFLELLDDPFAFYGQGGIGIRYNFN